MDEFKTILYPIALTEISHRVAPYVVTMARQLGAKVHVLHVLNRFDWFVDTYVSDPPEPDFKKIASEFEDRVLSEARQKLAGFQKKHLSGIEIVKSTVVSGTHYKQILKYAKAEDIDLIIMGTGTTLQNMVLGSVTGKVSKLSTVPVMLI